MEARRKDTKTQDTDVDFDVERKTFRDEIKSLERECARLEQICRNAKVDTHTRILERSMIDQGHLRNGEIETERETTS